MTSLSLSALSLGLPAFIAVKVLAPGYYARQDTRTPVRFAIISMVSNMVLNLLFVGVLLALHFKGPHAGLALASAVASYINAYLLYQGLREQGVYRPAHDWSRVLLAVLTATFAMAVWLLWRHGNVVNWLAADALARSRMLAELIVSGIVVYLVVMFGSGLRKHHLEKGAV